MSANVGASTGMIAPDFTLKDGDNKPWNLAEQRGKAVVLLFYPADETPVCTRQMCSVRDRWKDYSATGAVVVGISANTVESHKSFAENHNLPLTLLSDPQLEVAKLYSAMSAFPGKMGRAVVVIDPLGRVSYRKLRPLVGLLFMPRDDETIAAIKAALQ
ncbi:MAG: thioredoxin-dependent peroxiredoxin [Blastocatellia bacterium]|nr:thioredoxin-dependent peroxiredoxin [Blastocatellia bacterium]